MNDRMLEKIRQLMNLANPEKAGSPEEAATALKMAQKMMEKYRISEAMLEDLSIEDQEEIEDDILHSANGIRLAWWKRLLAMALSDVNGCKVYTSKNRKDKRSMINVIGEPSDASVVRYMYNYIANEIDRLTLSYSAARGNPGKTACNSFRLGAVEMITERLKEAHEEAREEIQAGATGDALVKVATAIAKLDQKVADANKWAKKNLKLHKTSTRQNVDESAKRKGRQAGKGIDLSSPGRKIGKGTRGYLPS